MLLSHVVAETSNDFYIRIEGDFQLSFTEYCKSNLLFISYYVNSVLHA